MGFWGNRGYPITNYSEEDLEKAVSVNLHLIEEGLELIGRQVGVGAGIVDILARHADGGFAVIEVKRHVIDCDAVGQLLRYMNAIDNALHVIAARRAREAESEAEKQRLLYREIVRSGKMPMGLHGYLVAPEIKPDAKLLVKYLNHSHPYWFIEHRSISLLSVPNLEEPENNEGRFNEEETAKVADRFEEFVPPVDVLLQTNDKESDEDNDPSESSEGAA